MSANGMVNVVFAYAARHNVSSITRSKINNNKNKFEVTDRDRLRKVLVCQKCKIAVDVVTGEPASASIHFAIPPATRITIEDSDHLPGAEGETGSVALLGDVVVHSKDEFRLRWLRGHLIYSDVCVDGSLRVQGRCVREKKGRSRCIGRRSRGRQRSKSGGSR